MDAVRAISPSPPGLAGAAGKGAGLRRFLKLPRSLSITREGKAFIGVLLAIGIAAINTGNNLLYLVVAAMLSIIIVSGLMSEATLRGLRLRRTLPPFAIKGAPACIPLKIENAKRLFSSYSFRVAEGEQGPSPAYVVRLRPGESRELRLEYVFPKRGVARLGPMRVTTRFPFGLFVKGKEEPGGGELLVLPSTDRALAIEVSGSCTGAEKKSAGRGSGNELYGLRDYGLADDARHIHWRSAARKEGLLMKEFERESGRLVNIVFENRRGESGEAFEALVDRAAATAAFHIDSGGLVGLRTLGKSIPPRPGRAHLMTILRELALIVPVSGEGPPSLRFISA